MRIGIFGGTFDPIHNGHIGLAEHFHKCLQLDEVWFLISPVNPWKKDNKISSNSKRLQWAEVALRKYPYFKASDYEFHYEGVTYSYRTLSDLRKDFPEHDFVLLIGADNWVSFDKWCNYEEILQNHHIAVYPRSGYPIDESTTPENVTILPPCYFEVSGTQIRELLADNKDVSHLVPSEIIELL